MPNGYCRLDKSAWNNDFIYEFDPAAGRFTVISYGIDGEEGGDDRNKDLLSTD